ncbi:aspartate/glutamate racemase family protein [Paraglaciecola hydrolytica]|uniref:Aspartate racemase n=1 Tax=Paraglaciecola hydrolytica TaxID=1799789 RepID=A0A148KM36_9ALTE|nr:aspartate/glutamate racemase family protein [Paraglaciecola hydrolytica]KXI27305.1 aspartate racemase [Paraglaciecola hydrolytica]
MQTIGLIGGMSWESTASYYQLLNREVKQRLGGLHSAKIVLVSVDFAEIEQLQHQGNWQQAGDVLAQAAQSVEAAGADFFLICTNTMHKVAEQVSASVSIPLLHIADATGAVLIEHKIKKVALLGTRFTMQEDFYKKRITESFGIEVLVPSADEQTLLHDIIYQELCLGIIKDDSRRTFMQIMQNLVTQGAEGIILGCTEIGLLISQAHTQCKLFDTTSIHVNSAVNQALS